MPKITKHDLITYCKQRDSEVCNDCEMREPCRIFFEQYGYLPYWLGDEHMTEEVIEWTETR